MHIVVGSAVGMETPARERLERWVAKLELEYRWAQRDDAVVVTLPLPKDATKAQVEVTIKADRLVAGLQGREPSVSVCRPWSKVGFVFSPAPAG